MPFSGPSSYLPTIDEFIGHWTDVDAALAPGSLTLAGPYALADLQNHRDELSDKITELVVMTNDVEGHRTDRDNSKEKVKERCRQLAAYVRGALAGSSYVGRIPSQIDLLANPGKWLIFMRDNVNIWADINAAPPAGFVPPLILNGPYTHANFVTQTTALETTFENLTLAEQDATRLVDERDAIYLAVRAQLVRYRDAVPGFFPAGHPLILSLPRLDPLPGHTPDPVVLSGVWNQVTSKGDFSWTASSDPDLSGYQLRRDGSTPYNTATEQVVESFTPATLNFSTDSGLTIAGSTMGFKLYVILETGNEAGSNTVTITHPLDG